MRQEGPPAAMRSGSGAAEPVHGQHAAATASPRAVAADASPSSSPPPLPPASPLERPQEQAGGSCSAAAAGVDRKGEILASAPAVPSSESSSPSSEDADAAAAGAGRFDSRAVFHQLLHEQTAIREAGGRRAAGAGRKKKSEEAQVKSSHAIGALWNNVRKFFHGEEWHYSQHVNHQTRPITEVRKYYLVPEWLRDKEWTILMPIQNLDRSKFLIGRTHMRNTVSLMLLKECLCNMQILDGPLNFPGATEDAHFLTVLACHRSLHCWHKLKFEVYCDVNNLIAFKKLIKKVKRWKRHGRWKWNSIASTSSYRKEKLLEFFRSYDTTEDILTFLRLVVAIRICSQGKKYELSIPGLDRHYSLKDWCFQHVTRSREYADHVMMTALAEALEVPLRVELLSGGPAQDIYTGPEPGVPIVSVILLYTGNHYDVLYPRAPPTESSNQQTS